MTTRIKQVVLSVMHGSFQTGFPVMLEIKSNTELRPIARQRGYLPPNPRLLLLLQQWQSAYHLLITPQFRLGAESVQVTNISSEDISFQLVSEYNNWLSSDSIEWRQVKNKIAENLDISDEIVVSIETDDIQVQQLPWHLWDLFLTTYTKSEIVLSIPEYQQLKNLEPFSSDFIKILAILGTTTGIDIQRDKALLLEKLPKAKIEFLIEPPRKGLTEKLWEKGWNILYFAGHSSSQSNRTSGQISINQLDSLTISDLKHALTTAVKHGLKLAIFNSCDGLGLARAMVSVGVPYVIVMREPVPDVVAQEFLKYFLPAFAGGKSVYLAVREARLKLEGLEDEYPYASWLPVIFQASAQGALTWSELINSKSLSSYAFKRRNLGTALLISALVTSLCVGLRYFQALESLELTAFDSLMRLRSKELPDRRLLLVTVEEEDLSLPEQKDRKGSLSDRALEKLLEKLDTYQPRVIGLDIYRDYPVNPKYQSLATRMRQSDRFIAVCKASDAEVDPKGIAPPPEVSLERLGFSDFVTDRDGIVRRQFLLATPEPTSACATPYSFSTMLALYYLAAQNILVDSSQSEIFKIGNTAFPRLTTRANGYQNLEYGGYQILLNYRSLRSPELIAERVTLTQVLNDRVNPKYIKDRIILIGTTANSFPDFWSTPYNSSPNDELSGVFLQAQMVSQILAAVLDHRPLFSVWPYWQEIIWIFGWSLFGGIIACQFKSGSYWILALVGGKLCLFVVSFALLIHNGYWVPLVPSVIALAASSIIVRVF